MNNQKQDDEKYKQFQRKICLDLAIEPVITPHVVISIVGSIFILGLKRRIHQPVHIVQKFLNQIKSPIFPGDSKESNQSEISKRPTNPRQEQEQTNQQQQFGNFQFQFGFGMPFMMMSNFNFGQGQQANARSFMIVFFLGFLMMNILPFFNSYFQETPQQTERRSKRQQNSTEDYLQILDKA